LLVDLPVLTLSVPVVIFENRKLRPVLPDKTKLPFCVCANEVEKKKNRHIAEIPNLVLIGYFFERIFKAIALQLDFYFPLLTTIHLVYFNS
jgi:hypothetical protein